MDYNKVRQLVDRSYKKGGVIGLSVALSEQGNHTWFNVGYANLQEKRSVTADTVFPIASCTKSIFGSLVAILAGQKLVDLDAPIASYFPAFAVGEQYVREHLTLRDILSHRSGMPADTLDPHDQMIPEADALEITLGALPQIGSFREKFQYNNRGYALAGHIISHVCGNPWLQIASTEIFEKLQMSNVKSSMAQLKSTKDRALRYTTSGRGGAYTASDYECFDLYGPAACLSASTADMIKWSDIQMNRGKHGREFDELLLWQAHKPWVVVDVSFKNPFADTRCHGLGWFVEYHKNQKLVYHTGSIDGFASLVFFMPDMGFGGAISASVEGVQDYLMIAYMYALAELRFGYDPNWTQLVDMLKNA